MNSKFVELTREQLYREVWAQPVMKVAARLGISGNQLGKICRKLAVPVPPRGYWALNAIGQATERPALPPHRRGVPLVYQLAKRPPIVLDAERDIARLAVPVAEELTNPHPLVKAAAAKLRASVKDGYADPAASMECLDIAVGATVIDRALRIMDALVKAAEERGHRIEVTTPAKQDQWVRRHDERRSRTHIVIGDEKVRVCLEEAYAAPSAGGGKRLTLFTDTYGGDGERQRWRDTRARKVEDHIGEFIEAAERIAAFCRERSLEWKHREEDAARRRHHETLLQELHQRAELWDAARRLSAYLDAVIAAAPEAADPQSAPGAVVVWAREQAQLTQHSATDVRTLSLDPARHR